MKTTDLTQGKPLRLILLFTLPIVLGNVCQTFYNVADSAIVGRFAGLTCLAAVGSTSSLSFFIFGFLYGLTGGFSIIVAQRRGARDEDGLRHAVAQSVLLTAILGSAITAIFIPLTRPILRLMNTPADILDDATTYLVIIIAGTLFSAVYNIASSILRAIGDSRSPLYFLILASVINILLDILFVLPLKMGVAGAALATIIAQALSGILATWYALSRYPVLRPCKRDLRPDRALLGEMLRLGLPMALQSSITAAGMIVLQSALNSFGSQMVAGYTAAGKVESFVAMPGFGLGTTMANYAGQNVGARKYRRLIEGIRTACVLILLWSLLSALFCIFLGVPVMRLFVTGEEADVAAALEAGHTYLVVLSCFFLPYNGLFIFRSTLQGMGKSIYTLVGGCAELVMRLLVAFFLPGLLGFMGLCLAGPAAWIGALIPLLSAWFYESRKLLRSETPPAAGTLS